MKPARRLRELASIRHARREMALAMLVWLAAMSYTVSYCGRHAYGRAVEELGFVWGMPDWIFWGVFLPWCASTAVSIWFALGWMQRDHLGVDHENALDEMMELE